MLRRLVSLVLAVALMITMVFSLSIITSASTEDDFSWYYENGGEVIYDYIIGDANNDKVVNVMDAAEIQIVLAEIKSWLNPSCELAADVDKDGVVSVVDAAEIQRFLAELSDGGYIGDVVKVYPEIKENRVYFDGFSIVLPEEWGYNFSGSSVHFYEKNNKEAGWDGDLITISKDKEKWSDHWNYNYLGFNNGYHYYSAFPTGVVYNPVDVNLRTKYEEAKAKLESTMATLKFETSTDGRVYFGDFSIVIPDNIVYEWDFGDELNFYSKYCYDNNITGINRGYVYSIVKTKKSPSDFVESSRLLGTKDGYNYIRLFPLGLGSSGNSKADAERSNALNQENIIMSSFKFTE